MTSKVVALFFSLVLLLTSAAAQEKAQATPVAPQATAAETKTDPSKQSDIRRLMEVTKATSLITQLMDSMGDGIRPVMSQSLPPGDYRDKLIDLFIAKFRSKADPKQLIDMAVPLYDKYFSDEEIKSLIKFYETPVGQKAVSALPQLTLEMQQNGRAWGDKLGRESMQEVLAEHPDLVEAMEAAGVKGKMSQP